MHKNSDKKLTLYGNPGWGSVIIEAQLAWYNLDFNYIETGDLFQNTEAREKLSKINPLAQIPTLVLENQKVMTESAAITLYLADLTQSNDLVPGLESGLRSTFFNWLLFITSNIYPTYTYADVPSRFVDNTEAQRQFKEAVNQYAKRLYKILDQGASQSSWFLGEQFSALDIYICTMTHWRPGKDWFKENTPRLMEISDKTKELPKLTDVWHKNFKQA